MDGRTSLDMKAISRSGSVTIEIEVRLTFEEQPDQETLLVRVKGELEHTSDQAEDQLEIEFVEGSFDPKTRKIVLLGKKRTGKFPKGHPPPPIDEHCDECDCNAYRTGFMVDTNHPCFCGHGVESHQSLLSHLVVLAQYDLTLPENLSEKFDAMAQSQRDPNRTAEMQFWEECVVVKPAAHR